MREQFAKTIAAVTAETGGVIGSTRLYRLGMDNGLTCREIKDNLLTENCKVHHSGRIKYDVRKFDGVEAVPSVKPKAQKAKAKAKGTASRIEPAGAAPSAPVAAPAAEVAPAEVANTQKVFADVDEVFIPDADPTFVAWGDFNNIRQILKSRSFFPVYIPGLSGNGKTMMVEQACAKEKREYVRVQISPETDETDLIGGFRLIDGETVFYKGPVLKAMERGAVLLIDELDRGTNKIMCLQGVLEGKPVLVKKIGQVITPAEGFNIIATGNTKGRGSEDGRFSAANIIDEAFIERFVATIEQPYPNQAIERNIVEKHMAHFGVEDPGFSDKLVAWSQAIRKTYADDGVDEVISTRRLCHIVRAHSIFLDRQKSIAMCIARFDEDTRSAFTDLYAAIDATPTPEGGEPTPEFADAATMHNQPNF